MENAQQLIAVVNDATERALSSDTQSAEAIQNARASLAQAKEAIENTTEQASTLLGEAHFGVNEIVAAASEVSVKVDYLFGLTEQLLQEITDLDGIVLHFRQQSTDIAERLMRGA